MAIFHILDGSGTVINSIEAETLDTAKAVVRAHEGAVDAVAHSGEAGVGWTTADGGETWADSRDG